MKPAVTVGKWQVIQTQKFNYLCGKTLLKDYL